jgi:hypothetical protein
LLLISFELLDDEIKLLEQSASCQQAVHNMSTSWEQAVVQRTHPDDKVVETALVYKSADMDLLQVMLEVFGDGNLECITFIHF